MLNINIFKDPDTYLYDIWQKIIDPVYDLKKKARIRIIVFSLSVKTMRVKL